MKTNYLKELAYQTVVNGMIEKNVEKFVLDKLSKSELKEYLLHLKRSLAKETLIVISATEIDATTKKLLMRQFGKKYVDSQINPKVGAGLVIKNNDDIIDLSLMGEIQRFIRTIS